MVALFFIRVRTRLERYCSKSVLLNERKLFEVRKRCLKVCSTIPLIRENRFNPFDFVALAISRFELSSHQNRMTLQNFLQKAVLIEHRVVYSARNFTNRQLLAKKKTTRCLFIEHCVAYRTSRCLFWERCCEIILFWCHQSSKYSKVCQWYEAKRIKSIFADKVNSETRFGAPLHFLNYFSFLQ